MDPVSFDRRLRIETRTDAERAVLELHGELDLSEAPVLAAELRELEHRGVAAIVLDLDDVSFLDSAGLRVILAARERARVAGGELALTAGTPQVRRLFEVAGVGDMLPALDTSHGTLAGGHLDGGAA